MQDFRKLKVWQKAHALTVEVYRVTRTFPREELFGLTSQLRRSSSSVPANIAEGCGRGTANDFCHFLIIGMGSASELEYHLLLSHDLRLMDKARYEELALRTTEVKRMLASLIKTARAKS